MITNLELKNYCNNYLQINNYKDYCSNGLQIEGKKEINKIISGVSCNLDLIEQAINEKADAIITHHGFFWKSDPMEIIGVKRKKIKLLLENNINLYSYHLPLDAHIEVGNNKQLANILAIKNAKPIDNSLVWIGNIDISTNEFATIIEDKLMRKPQIFGNNKHINKIAFCTGGAQNYINIAIENEADCYLSGEISEKIPAIAKENNIIFIQAGHHATERYGVQALSAHLVNKFKLEHKFIEIENIV